MRMTTRRIGGPPAWLWLAPKPTPAVRVLRAEHAREYTIATQLTGPRLMCRIPPGNATAVDVTTCYEHVSRDRRKPHPTRMNAAGGVCAATTGSATDAASLHHPTDVGATPLAPPAPTR